jgi:hypothetical protein
MAEGAAGADMAYMMNAAMGTQEVSTGAAKAAVDEMNDIFSCTDLSPPQSPDSDGAPHGTVNGVDSHYDHNGLPMI